jgi:gliding motility-associated-like protein
MGYWLCGLCMFIFRPAFSQTEGCPVNINFSNGGLTHWFAYTGNNRGGNGPDDILQTYDSTKVAPTGTIGSTTIPEYNFPPVSGIHTNSTNGTDHFGGFAIIPTINGYKYDYSVLLGSTTVSTGAGSGGGNPGGYIRGISYKISVPTSTSTQPYTMTYAYAMVLENGSHNSKEQPLISATLSTADSIVSCASPAYYLPTLDNASSPDGTDATLDTAAAIKNGFSQSREPSPNLDRRTRSYLPDVWTKGWTEVTFDLSPYRGQTVTLTFEADNCVPGGHFAYGYIAIRNLCNGLMISGDSLVCSNSNTIYSIPALAGASYEWSVPAGWTINSGINTNIINVTVGNQNGVVTAKEQNSCAHLQDAIPVKTVIPSVGGNITGDATVCSGLNDSKLTLSGNTGNVISWISSIDGVNWVNIPDITSTYIAQNLNATTLYEAIVQTNKVCAADTSSDAIITVDPKSIGGTLSPANTNICEGQDLSPVLTLTGNTGQITNWQSSPDNNVWTNFNPINTNSTYTVDNGSINISTQYRIIVKSGVCVADTSSVATIELFNTNYPKAIIHPTDTSVCYGKSAMLNATITQATSYTWTNNNALSNQGNGFIASTPFVINATATTLNTTDFILSITNTGCPNILMDTFHVNIVPPVIVNAGNDTSVVIGQPLQLTATTNDSTTNSYEWSPASYLDNPGISNPIAIFGEGVITYAYAVQATDPTGCFGIDSIHIKVYNVPPGIYVPNAFTPNGDGLNDTFKPITLGIKSLSLFRIYNRWGQLVFATSEIGKGWDGMVNGAPQNAGNYVWIADGIDYLGKKVQVRGNVLLVR